MAKEPRNIEWIVTGDAKLRGVTTTVHAPDRQEAIRKANAGEFIGGIDLDVGELVDYEFDLAEVGSDAHEHVDEGDPVGNEFPNGH